MNLLFRVDAGSALGVGHVARCLTLAAELVACGARVAFACRELPGHQMARIAAAGYPVYPLPLAQDDEIAALQASLPADARFDWIIVDHYGLDARWETRARQWARRVMVIDDLADRPHDCDLLLDQNFTASTARYQPRVPAGCRLLMGPRHALLRPAFRQARQAGSETARRVLVSFGGFDQAGMTLKTLQALAAIEQVEVQCIAGQGSADWPALQALVASRPGWLLHGFVDDLAARMGAATLFIGAGGGTTWERAAMGLPSLCVSVADNQLENAGALALAGVHLYLGSAPDVSVRALEQAIAVLLDNPTLRQHFAARGRELVDGLGARRVAVALLADGLHLRAATTDDARLLFDGRNAETVRRGALDPSPLDWGLHCRWLHATLEDPQRLLLIGENADGPLGVLRYDRLDPCRARVSLYLFDGRYGLGWGRALLGAGERAVRARWSGLEVIEAKVLADNSPSLALFSSAGYTQAECHFERVLKDSRHEQF